MGQAVASRVALVDRLNPQKQPTKKVCGNTTQYLSISKSKGKEDFQRLAVAKFR